MMNLTKQSALKILLTISIAGIIFSGYLSYIEIFIQKDASCSSLQQSASCACASCSQKILSIPVCVYGFIMYLAIFIISLLGLKSKK